MIRSRGRRIFIFALCQLLLLSLIIPAYAEEQTMKLNEPQKIGEAKIKNNVVAEINNLVMIPNDNGQTVGFTLTVHNNSDTELNFMDYWVQLYSKSGARFTVTAATTDVTKIAAKTVKDIMFYSQVGSSIKATDLVFKIIQWDFTYSDFTRVLGELAVPPSYQIVTPRSQGRVVSAGDSRISLWIERSHIGKSEKYHRPDIKITIKNEGKRTLILPDLEMSVLTGEGLLYPLTAKNLKGTVLDPLKDKEIQLTASIPIEVELDNWQLAVIMPVNEGKNKLPLALFELPDGTLDEAGDIGKYYTFSNSDGVYNIRLNSLNRLPLEDNDLIIANFTVANNGDETIPVPNLTALYKFNDSIEKAGTMSVNNKVISIAPGTTIDVQTVSAIPYTFDISKVNITIQQKETDSNNSEELLDLVEFTHEGEFHPIPVVKDKYVIEEIGYRSNVAIRNFATFTSGNTNMIVAEIEVENLEKRLTDIQKFGGYFEKSDGTVYTATFLPVKEKVSPGGRAILYAYATVPKGIDTSDFKLAFGKAVESGTGENVQLVGYANPHLYILPAEKEAQNHLQNIDLIPYTLSIERVRTQVRLDQGVLMLEFDYKLEQDLLVKSSLEKRKIIIELSAHDEKEVYSQTLELVGADAEASNTQLKAGSHTFTHQFPDDEFKMEFNKEFDFNIYAELEPGYKKLVATQKLPWLVDRTLTE